MSGEAHHAAGHAPGTRGRNGRKRAGNLLRAPEVCELAGRLDGKRKQVSVFTPGIDSAVPVYGRAVLKVGTAEKQLIEILDVIRGGIYAEARKKREPAGR